MDGADPRCEFITSLCEALGESGSIVVYNAAFESQRLAELAAWLPEFAGRIKNIQARFGTCCQSCGTTSTILHSAGRFPLKAVLPALVPEMTYEGMEVANGQNAGLAWESLVRGALDQTDRDNIRKALLEYCGQDTLAMVKLLEKLQSTCG